MNDAERMAAQLIADVARRIGELRTDAGLSQAQVAERIETTVSNYQRIEHGLQNVTLRTLARIAAALGVSPAQFFAPPEQPRRTRGRPRASAAREGGAMLAVADTLPRDASSAARRYPAANRYPTGGRTKR